MHDTLNAPPAIENVGVMRKGCVGLVADMPLPLREFLLSSRDSRTMEIEQSVLQFIMSLDDHDVFPPSPQKLIEFWEVWGNVRAVQNIATLALTPNPFDACSTGDDINTIQDELMTLLITLWHKRQPITKPYMYRCMWRSLMNSDPHCLCEFEDFIFLTLFLRICDSAEYRRRQAALNMGPTRTGGGHHVLVGCTRCDNERCPKYKCYKDHVRLVFLCSGCGL